MRKILLCSHNPILIKNLYGLFIDNGFAVEVVEQSSFAIKRLMVADIDLFVMDASTFGLTVTETIEIIMNLVPDMPYIVVGSEDQRVPLSDGIDFEGIRDLLRAIKEPDISFYKGVKNEA